MFMAQMNTFLDAHACICVILTHVTRRSYLQCLTPSHEYKVEFLRGDCMPCIVQDINLAAEYRVPFMFVVEVFEGREDLVPGFCSQLQGSYNIVLNLGGDDEGNACRALRWMLSGLRAGRQHTRPRRLEVHHRPAIYNQ